MNSPNDPDPSKTRVLNCDRCTACCKREAVMLHPEGGDNPLLYQTVEFDNPITGKRGLRLAHKPNGDCVYLGPHGCTNYDKRPLVCREFDCRIAFLKISRPTRRRMLKEGTLDADVVEAGRSRLETLSVALRAQIIQGRRA